MKSYFDEKLQHTNDSLAISKEIDKFLFKLYQSEKEKGMNLRELTALVLQSTQYVETSTVILIKREK